MNLPKIAELVTHESGMLLLDSVTDIAEASITVQVIPRADGMFDQDNHVGAWVGLEYMAQAMGALDGLAQIQLGKAPRIGFMLGTRRYHCKVARFKVGEPLFVKVNREFQADNGICVAQCTIFTTKNEVLVEALLSAYLPENLDAFLKVHS